jgi:hypothetical protein
MANQGQSFAGRTAREHNSRLLEFRTDICARREPTRYFCIGHSTERQMQAARTDRRQQNARLIREQ